MMEHYKGIMLCNRPQASINLDYHKPFVSRVTHAEPLGYNPVKQLQIHQPIKQIKPILSQHKEWLQNFQKHAKEKKTALHYSQVQSRLHPDRYQSNSDNQNQQNDTKIQQTSLHQNQSTKVEEIQQEQLNQQTNKNELGDEIIDDQELNELLDFTKNLDFEQYINDLEVKTVVEALKKRIEEIRIENPQLSQKEATKKALKQNNNNPAQKQIKKHVTIQEEEQLQKNLEKKETNLESVAKKIAEEILQKNKYLRNIHSNISMQKLVETEARRFLQKE
ncbi:unnamed protein product [Paramecium sonneborni]|uniref:Uncharacterized protein n=1 Tax=Paramecium sonneborni TaxID=65129 RepID=A0A8S1P8A8_9CILI|nr:unnamed protein product [Paramecium sonneborni]